MNKIIMPSSGQTTDESLIVRWYKEIGDPVARGDVLFEIETDKAALEVESYCDGILRAVYYTVGEKATTGQTVALIGTADEPLAEDMPVNLSCPDEEDEDQLIPTPSTANGSTPQNDERIVASPKAKYAARTQNIDLSSLAVDGIIKYADVINALPSTQLDEKLVCVPLSAKRRITAQRMTASVLSAPHYYVSMEIDMTHAVELRRQMNESLNGALKISFNDLIAKCAANAIERFPIINASFTADGILYHATVNVGLAVNAPDGLVVPVIRDVQDKKISQIATESADMIRRAKENRLRTEEMQNGTITISNLGMFGVDAFTAIINQPESCILAVGAIRERAVSVKRQIVSRDMLTITASFDHRVIDGVLGAQFMQELKRLLENPLLLLL